MNLASVYNLNGHSHIGLIRYPYALQGQYTSNEVDMINTADIPLDESLWDPYLPHTTTSHRGDGCYTEVIVQSLYNIWAML